MAQRFARPRVRIVLQKENNMADSNDKIGQKGQGTIDVARPKDQKAEQEKQDDPKMATPPYCGPSGCTAEQLKEQQKPKAE